MPGFRSRQEALLTTILLVVAMPGMVIDIVLLVDMVVHGRAVATAGLSWTGDLVAWLEAILEADAWLAGNRWLAGAATLILLGAMVLGLPCALALVFGLPAWGLAYLIRKAERSG